MCTLYLLDSLRFMRQLTLIRHALTDWNSSGKFQGHSEVLLSAEGKAQARALARRLRKSEAIDAVYSSPLKRSAETASTVFPGRDIIFDDRLKELHFGVFETFTLAQNKLHPRWAWWTEDPFQRQAPQGESYRSLRERAVAWLGDLPKEGHSVAFTHSGFIQMLLSHLLGIEHPRWRKRIFIRHTGITRILFSGSDSNDNDVVIERVNDTRHLSSEAGDPFDD